jgi:hypothetical protein
MKTRHRIQVNKIAAGLVSGLSDLQSVASPCEMLQALAEVIVTISAASQEPRECLDATIKFLDEHRDIDWGKYLADFKEWKKNEYSKD